MKRNVSGQVIGAQLNSKTDGSAVTTGTTTVYVTGDGGVQGVGSVGAGACTHEGQGFWTYAPAQAETDFAHIAFTFQNAAAVQATVQVYPSFPQTGDTYARVGAPVGASLSADIAWIQADTDNLQTRLPAALVGGRIDADVGAIQANAITATAIAADAITDAKVAADVTIASVTGAVGSVAADVSITQAAADKVWNSAARTLTSFGTIVADTATAVWGAATRLLTAGTNIVLAKGVGVTGFNDLSAAQVNAEADTALADVGVTSTVTGRIDVAVSTRLAAGDYTAPDNVGIAAIQAKTDNLPIDPADQSLIIAATDAILAALADKTGYRLSATGVSDILRTALTEGYAANGDPMTLEQAVHMVWSMLSGKGIVGTTLTTRQLDGTTAAMTFHLDSGTAPTVQTRTG